MKAAPLRMLIAGMILFVAGAGGGLLLTVVGMMGAFHSLGENGIANINTLAGHIGMALIATMVGLVISGFGLVTMVIAAIVYFVDRKSSKPSPSP